MLKRTCFRKFSPILKGRLGELQILVIYRFASLFITSSFYILGDYQHSLFRKLFIIGCLLISSIILSYLYYKNSSSEKAIKMLLFIETIGNAIILIPSGGIYSSFIWYSLNTILISSIFLKKIYCYLNLLTYVLAYFIIAYLGNIEGLYYVRPIRQELNLIMSFVMIVTAIQVWSMYVKKLNEKNQILWKVNRQLELANQLNIEYIEHIESLYKSVSILTNQGNKEGIIKLLYDYAKDITKSEVVFYYDISENTNRMVSDSEDGHTLDLLESYIKDNLDYIYNNNRPIEIELKGTKIEMMPVRTIYKNYGILGCEITDTKNSYTYKNNSYQLKFLSDLISTAFERLDLEDVNDRLLISEEQNRIANEIHDSVLQRLFSLSCGIFALKNNLKRYSHADIENELEFMRDTISEVMKELRNKIYGLSWKEKGINGFKISIKRYIDETTRLNNVFIPFTISGNDELLTHEQKKAIYRIICEGISNAVRHGKAKNIDVSLNIESQYTTLNIADDGVGFDLASVLNKKMDGIGIHNLYQLSESLGGSTNISSTIGKGTEIQIKIPNMVSKNKKEALV